MRSVLRSLPNTRLVNKRVSRNTSVSAINVDENTQNIKPWEQVPGPPSLPIIGQLHHFLPGGSLGRVKTLQQDSFNTYGPLVRIDSIFGRPPFLFLFDPESCAQILHGENWLPIRGGGFASLKYYRDEYSRKKGEVFGPRGLITDNGEKWKRTRSAVNPVLLQTKTIKLYSNALDEVSQDFINRLKSKRNEGNTIQEKFDYEMNLWSLESIGVVALGRRLKCFEPLEEDSPVKKLIQCTHEFFEVVLELDFKPSLWRIYPTKTYRKAMKIYEEHEALTKYFVRKSVEELKHRTEVPEDEKGVLEKLLEINEEIAFIVVSDMLFAGVDTSTNTVIGTLYLLAANQDKQNKLRDKLKSGDRYYLKACIKEALRIMPITPGNIRQTTKEYNLMGYRIPKGITVLLLHQTMSMMENQFPRPKEFIPERWIDKDSPLYHGNQAHPFAYSPFGFGVRSCIGRRIAELEMETLLVKMMENFKVEWVGPPPQRVLKSVIVVAGPYNFVFKDL